jgi:hypothetical protein
MSSAWATEVDWTYVVFTLDKELHGLGSYAAVASAMQADPQVARHLDTMVGDGGSMFRVDVTSSLRTFLLYLLIGQTDLIIDGSKFENLYGELETYFYSDLLKRRCLSPLTSFEMEADQIELGRGLLLRRLSVQEREAMASSLASFMPFPHHITGAWPTGWEKFTLDLSFEVPKVIGERSPDLQIGGAGQIASGRFQSVISALRLFKTGMVDLTTISTTSVGWDIFGGLGLTGRTRLPILGTPYTLSKAEGSAFVAFWADFHKRSAKKNNRIELAMRRFNQAYERLSPEDRLIDYVIALEALLMKGGELQELGFRLALRGSVLLGQNANTRSEVFLRLRSAYSQRSHIVHGSAAPSEVRVASGRIPFHQFVDAVADDLRAIIRRMLELTETTGEAQVIASLDEKIVRWD